MKYTYLLILLTSYATVAVSAQKPLAQQAVNILNRFIAPHLRAVAISLDPQANTPVVLPENCQDPILHTIKTTPGFFQLPVSVQVVTMRHFATYFSLHNSANQPNNRWFFEKLWNIYPSKNESDIKLPSNPTQIPDSIIYQESLLITFQETTCPICQELMLMPIPGRIMNPKFVALLQQSRNTSKPCLCKAHEAMPHKQKLEDAIRRKNQRRATLLDNQNTNMDDRLTNQPPLK